ncbi:MAG: HEPN domain-containing protein [Elusimicrobia bacterium]|nr:HEPN domain-containing protein [Elusimicrobiota bacterium]
MGLIEKSKENIEIAEKYLKNNKFFNIIANRAYYATVQMAKNYLCNKNVVKPHGSLRHGEIKPKIKSCIVNQNVANKITFNLATLKPLDNLGVMYNLRWTADYSARDISAQQAKDCLDYAKDIIDFIEKSN